MPGYHLLHDLFSRLHILQRRLAMLALAPGVVLLGIGLDRTLPRTAHMTLLTPRTAPRLLTLGPAIRWNLR